MDLSSMPMTEKTGKQILFALWSIYVQLLDNALNKDMGIKRTRDQCADLIDHMEDVVNTMMKINEELKGDI